MANFDILNVQANDIYDNSSEYDSNYDDLENDNENYDDLYEPEEKDEGYSRYNIVLCELYNRHIHGVPENISENLDTHYLLSCRFKTFNIEFIKSMSKFMNREYLRLNEKERKHYILKNYSNIISQPNYIKPEIAECIYLNSNECIAILKTFWIRLIQRKWKNIYKERQDILKLRCSYKSLKHRELTGRWPNNCCYYPRLRGMLNNIK
jgi:hypothetical protein